MDEDDARARLDALIDIDPAVLPSADEALADDGAAS
ncbi:MAG: hypothetical protein RLZZ157_97 [Pseudomonadota bacterium]|jgi:hypothetical protein